LWYRGNSNILMLTHIYYLLANEKYKHAFISYVYFKISVNTTVKKIHSSRTKTKTKNKTAVEQNKTLCFL